MYYIASCSCGKDSLAMVLRLMEENRPLDEIVFYDTGMEFQAIYTIAEKLKSIAESKGIVFTTLYPPYDFLYKAFEKPVVERNGGGKHYGYSWCGGRCRWGTTDKLRIMDEYALSKSARVYVGIAADEQRRLEKERSSWKEFPLYEWGMTEQDCLDYCYAHGWNWRESDIDLYEILDRVSCWCCSNKNRKELKNIYRYLPEYWQKLKDFQSKTSRPMKKYYRNGVPYGTVPEMEEVFKEELEIENH